jgi:putative RecB family exonuclease
MADEIKLIKTSFSALDTFQQCPLKYKYQQIDKIRAPKIKEAVFGNKIHKALQFFHSKQPVSPTLDELLNYLKENWESEVFLDEQEDMIWFGEAIKILKNYYNNYTKLKYKPIVLDTETRFEVLLENPKHKDQKSLLRGIIDRIDKNRDGVEVIDYKTSKRLPSQQDVDKSPQLSLYALGLAGRWTQFVKQGIENIKLTFYSLKHQEAVSTNRTKQQLDDVREQVWDRLKKIEKSEFQPTPSPLCDWCGYKKICPMWKHLYKEQMNIDDEQAKKVVDEYFELKEQNSQNNKKLSELKELVERYLDKEKLGRVFGKDGYITRLTQVRHSYDLDKLTKDELEKIKKDDIEYTVLKTTRKRVDKDKK